MHEQLYTIRAAQEALAEKTVSSRELADAARAEVARRNPELNAVRALFDRALEDADASDARRAAGETRGALDGVPIFVKDNMLVAGELAGSGSRMLENYRAAYDATVVERLRAAGAVLLGSTNMDEFAMGSSGETSHNGPAKNPWDVSRVPGGSSSGSAVAVAAGFTPAALGSDTGGSIRLPAALTGLTGLKPTYGRVSRYGLMSLASSLDQIGPFARTAEDVSLVLNAIEGEDPKDATTVSGYDRFLPELAERTVKGMTFGVPKEYFVDGMDPRVRETVESAIRTLEAEGASVREVSLPHAPYALAAYYVVNPAEASSNLGRYDGLRYGFSPSADTLEESYVRARTEGFGEEVKRRILVGTYVLSKGYYDAYYRKALRVRTLIRRDFERAFADVDALLAPITPGVAWKLGEKIDDPLTMYLADIFTISANLAGIPALSVPCGFVENLPVGLQIMGPAFGEPTLFRAAMAYQTFTDWHTRVA